MSYTLKGRVDTRVAASLAPLVAACVWAALVRNAWPVEVAGLMVAVGVVLDALVWDRLEYQAAWAALPLGAVELAVVYALVRGLGIDAPPHRAIAFFVGAWLLAQVVGHAVLPLARLTYSSDGGELGTRALAVVLVAVLAGAAGVARAAQPGAMLVTGTHGRLVIRRPVTLVGAPGSLVRGGVVVRSDDVTLRNLTIAGGDNGVDVENVHGVRLEHLRIRGARLDGIHVRRAAVVIRDCSVDARGAYAQGIDISFAMSYGMSVVRGCRVVGGLQGIVVHTANVLLSGNRVRRTGAQAIAVTEMSMGMIDRNRVSDALGVGIYCGDSSVCEIEHNVVAGVRADTASGDSTRMGFAIEAHSNASATVRGNRARRVRAFLGSEILH